MKVLFVCRANVGRSQVAMELYRQMGGTADSAGTEVDFPGTTVGERRGIDTTLKVVREDFGIDMSKNIRRQLTEQQAASYDKIIVMAEMFTVPEWLQKDPRAVFWTIDDAKGQDEPTTRRIMHEVNQHVKDYSNPVVYSQKYTIVQFFQQIDEGETFAMADWPLHTTLADVFAINITDELMSNVQRYINTQPMAKTYIKSEATLGTTNVWLLENTTELQNIHTTLVGILNKHGVIFNNPEFTASGYIPHITKQAHASMNLGDAVIVNTWSLVDMFPDGNWQNRTVTKHFVPDLKQ